MTPSGVISIGGGWRPSSRRRQQLKILLPFSSCLPACKRRGSIVPVSPEVNLLDMTRPQPNSPALEA
jgi:hypothetical protein